MPMLGDVGCKMDSRLVQEAFESQFLPNVAKLGGHLGAKMAR